MASPFDDHIGSPGNRHPDEDWRELNRASWDERVAIHVDSAFYDNPGFRAGRSSLRPFEVDETYWLPAGLPRLPLIYSLRARKPLAG